jgi:hypothetical protein
MYKTEFPDFKLDVPIPAGFTDNSWHNDTMPNWIRELPDGQMILLWIDYADPAMRDHPKNARFVLHVMDSTLTDVHDSFVSNDYDAVLQQLTQFFPWIHLSNDQLMELRSDLWAKVPDDDHARNFSELGSLAEIDDEILARSLTVGVE